MADGMDFEAIMADFELPSSSTTSTKSTSFKPSRFRPKPRGATTAPAVTAKTTIKPKIEAKKPTPTPPVPTLSSPNTNPKMELDTNPKIETHAEQEDEVEREINVFLTPFPVDENETDIYIMQYPLRPNWQTYEMEKRCTEVRMMPKSKKMEVDLCIDDDHRTFDADMARLSGIDKQTLRSLVAPSATDYAVGILIKDQIHLNPINGVVQLRPVIMSDHQKRKRTAQQMDPEKNVQDSTPSSSKMTKTSPGDSTQTEDEDESWVPLEFLPEGSICSNEYHKKMVTTKHKEIEFTMTQSDYMGALCPGETINRRETKEAIIKELRELPLEERLKKWFTEVQLNRFDFIEYLLAPVEPVEEVLQQVQMLADLVRGVWVTKTSLLYTGYEAMVRDYILLQFTKGDSIPCEKLRANLGREVLKNEVLRPLLGHLIIRKPKEDKVKFKGSPDPTFRKRHHDVVKGQVEAWLAREESILERVRELNKNGVSGTKRVVVMKEDKDKKVADNSLSHGDGGPAMSASKSISVPETRKHLIEALNKIFDEQKVRTIRSVVRDLRELAKRLSALPKSSDKNKHLIDGALSGAYAAQTELQNVVSVVAVHVHGVFVMKAPKQNHLRNVFIKLFRDKAKAVLRKKDIMELGEQIFKREISESEYAQVVDDICMTTEDGGLMLRTGD
ncbi:DNA-directed RNA polymerase III subunit RPC5 isoform X3 [Carex littledalei]|uniref:DNA-directed RNA polymerase III subunit RPC5 isoform X3 n=1 Tax=Carex littledalei TaxID=544730 RepID=A0A833QUU0_9POAL|nr:DNA-directed RNA polymerase III subunit RPC5 isoform X3 [Carex littledalei]